MNKNSKTVSTVCGKCDGSGRFFYGDRSRGACYPCNGSGRIMMSAAELEAAKAYAAKLEIAREQEIAAEQAENDAFLAAEQAILSRGINGAREFFAANRTNPVALAGLIFALRNARMESESNAVCRHRNAL